MKKNIIITIVVIILIAGLALGFYYFYLKPQAEINETSLSEKGGGILPTITVSPTPSTTLENIPTFFQPVLKKLTTKNILAFWQSSTSTLQYLTPDGLFEINHFDLKEEQKDLGINFSTILSIEPSTKGKVLIKYLAEGATKPAYSILDINTREIKNLDLYVKSATWSPDGNNLIYYYSDSPLYYQENFKESSYLAQLDKNLANRKIIMNFKTSGDINLLWPESNTVYIIEKPSGMNESTILSFDLKNKIFTPFVNGNGLILKWDHLGKYGLLFRVESNNQQPKLSLINKDALVLAEIPNITLPDKCVFANNKSLLYCSIFVNPNFGGIWPDVYYMGMYPFDEMIYEINLETLEAKLLNNNTFRIKDIKISNDDKFLFFFDEKTYNFYSLSLEPETISNSLIESTNTSSADYLNNNTSNSTSSQ
ncbi:MAG TPA: hypothetical protein PK168_00395 [Candidatus Paceibacterota bacterium]|nr:hypothetical protein [Candidatus Paceibacterota bacterium]HPC37319.1 hypothetical protein [Candidatus Paceibacterota bacterium]